MIAARHGGHSQIGDLKGLMNIHDATRRRCSRSIYSTRDCPSCAATGAGLGDIAYVNAQFMFVPAKYYGNLSLCEVINLNLIMKVPQSSTTICIICLSLLIYQFTGKSVFTTNQSLLYPAVFTVPCWTMLHPLLIGRVASNLTLNSWIMHLP